MAGWRWRWRSVTLRVTRVTHTYVITAHRACHHRPPSPMSLIRARGSGGGAFSFARLLARAEAEAEGWGRRLVTSRFTRVTHGTRVARHARARAHHHRFARVITVFRPPRARRQARGGLVSRGAVLKLRKTRTSRSKQVRRKIRLRSVCVFEAVRARRGRPDGELAKESSFFCLTTPKDTKRVRPAVPSRGTRRKSNHNHTRDAALSLLSDRSRVRCRVPLVRRGAGGQRGAK